MEKADKDRVVQVVGAVNFKAIRSIYRIYLGVVLSILLVAELQAATWGLERGVAVGLSGSEERNETPQSTETSSLVRISPYLGLSGRGLYTDLQFRASLNLQYGLDDKIDYSDTALKFGSNTRFIERVFSVSSAASVSERVVDADGIEDNAALISGSRARIGELSITPLLRFPFGSDGVVQTTLRFSTSKGTVNDEAIGGDTTDLVSEVSQSTRQGLIASVRLRVLTSNFDSGEKSETASVSGSASQPVGRTLSFYASGGYETLRLGPVDVDEKGETWRVGLNWNPSARVAVDISYGRRLFGRNPRLLFKLQGRRSLLQLSLTRDLAFERTPTAPLFNAGLVQEAVGSLDVEDSEFDPGDSVGTLSPISRDARAIEDRASVRYTLFGNKSELSGAVSWYERSQFDDEDTVATSTLELAFLRSLTSKADILVTLSEQMRESVFVSDIEKRRISSANVVFNYVL